MRQHATHQAGRGVPAQRAHHLITATFIGNAHSKYGMYILVVDAVPIAGTAGSTELWFLSDMCKRVAVQRAIISACIVKALQSQPQAPVLILQIP